MRLDLLFEIEGQRVGWQHVRRHHAGQPVAQPHGQVELGRRRKLPQARCIGSGRQRDVR